MTAEQRKRAIAWLILRLKEASTWWAITVLLTTFCTWLEPEQVGAIVTAGALIFGAIDFFKKDSNSADAKPKPNLNESETP